MSYNAVPFEQIRVERPEYSDVAAKFARFDAAWDAASSADACRQVIHDWDELERQLSTWINLVGLRFNQDTSNVEYKQAREYCDELKPRLTDLAVRLKRKLISTPFRKELEATFACKPSHFGKPTYSPSIQRSKRTWSRSRSSRPSLRIC